MDSNVENVRLLDYKFKFKKLGSNLVNLNNIKQRETRLGTSDYSRHKGWKETPQMCRKS